MKLFALILIFVISLAVPIYANANEPPFEVHIFYLDTGGVVCAACAGDYALERELVASINSIFRNAIHEGQIVFRYYNLNRNDNFGVRLSERADLLGLDLDSAEMPIFLTQDNRYFYGDEALTLLYEKVSEHLLPALEAGEGLITPLITEQQPEPRSTLNLMIASLALIISGGSIYYWRKKRGEKHS